MKISTKNSSFPLNTNNNNNKLTNRKTSSTCNRKISQSHIHKLQYKTPPRYVMYSSPPPLHTRTQRNIKPLPLKDYVHLQQSYNDIIHSIKTSQKEIKAISSDSRRSSFQERTKIKTLEQKPIRDLHKSKSYTHLQKLFSINSIDSINMAYHGNITLQVTKNDNSPQTIMLSNLHQSHIPNRIHYWELPSIPSLTFDQSGIIGGYKEIIKVEHNGSKFVLAKDLTQDEQERNTLLKEFQDNIHKALSEDIPGAELLSIPYLLTTENQETILVQSLVGEKDLDELAHQEGKKQTQSISTWKARLRDMYMANKLLEFLGYYNCDAKLENAVLLPNGRVATIDIDMLPLQQTPPIYTYNILNKIWDICSQVAENSNASQESATATFFALSHPLVLLRELDYAIHGGKKHIFTANDMITTIQRTEPEAQLFITCDSPLDFLSLLKKHYEERGSSNDIERIIEIEKQYKDIPQDCSSNILLSKKIDLSNLLSRQDIKIVKQHYESFQKQSGTRDIEKQKVSLTASQENNRDFDKAHLEKYVYSVCTTPQAIENQIQEIRNRLEISPHRVSNEELRICIMALYDTQALLPQNPTQHHLKILGTKLNNVIAKILEVENYKKAEVSPSYKTLQIT